MPELIKLDKVTLKRTCLDFAETRVNVILENVSHIEEFLPAFANSNHSIEDETNYINICNERWNNKEAYNYSVFENSTGEFIGNFTLFSHSLPKKVYEFGYWLAQNKQGNGYITQIVKALEKFAEELLDFNRLIIVCNEVNKKSAQIAIRNGYLFEHKAFCADIEGNSLCFVKLKNKKGFKELNNLQDDLKSIYHIDL